MSIKNIKESSELMHTYLDITKRDIRKAKRQLKRLGIPITADSIVTRITGTSIDQPLCVSAGSCEHCVFSLNIVPTFGPKEPPCHSISHGVLMDSATDTESLKASLFGRALYIAELGYKAEITELHETMRSVRNEASPLLDVLGFLADAMYGEGTADKIDSFASAVINGSMSDDEVFAELEKIRASRIKPSEEEDEDLKTDNSPKENASETIDASSTES